jgi:hypothetical protein
MITIDEQTHIIFFAKSIVLVYISIFSICFLVLIT